MITRSNLNVLNRSLVSVFNGSRVGSTTTTDDWRRVDVYRPTMLGLDGGAGNAGGRGCF